LKIKIDILKNYPRAQRSIKVIYSISIKGLALLGIAALIYGASSLYKEKQFQIFKVKENPISYIQYATKGYISPEDPIEIRFKKSVITNLELAENREILKITPSIAGKAIWQNDKTLIFKPDNLLPLNTKFIAVLKLSKLKKCKNVATYKFSFETKAQLIKQLNAKLVVADQRKRNEFYCKGEIEFSVATNIEAIKKAMSLSSKKKNIPLTWQKNSDNKKYTFTSDILLRTDNAQKFKILIKKTPLNLPEDVIKELTCASLYMMKPIAVSKQISKTGLFLKVTFSDKIDPKQNIEGFINVKGLDISTKIFGDEITVAGKYKPGKTYELSISPGIKNDFGIKMAAAYSKFIRFEEEKPQVRFVHDGIYVPSDNDFKILFETINLKRIHIQVKKVLEEDLDRLIEENLLKGKKEQSDGFSNYYINRAGIPLASETFVIEEKPNAWLLQEVDLSRLIKGNKSGTYLINLSFTKSDMLYSALEEDKKYDGKAYYDNPNSPGYFMRSQRFKPLIFSDIALTVKKTGKRLEVYATDIRNGAPLKDVQIILRDKARSWKPWKRIKAETTDENGIAYLAIKKTGHYGYVLAKKRDQRSVLLFKDSAWNLSTFDIGGANIDIGSTRAFVYTERGVYRPGDDVNLSLIARYKSSFPANHPVTLELVNPKSQAIYKQTKKKSKDGFYSFKIKTKTTDLTGKWTARLTIGGKEFYHPVRIETVVPYKLKVNIDAEKKVLSKGDSKVKALLKSSYLFGAPAQGNSYKVKLKLETKNKTFAKYPGFLFTNEIRKFKGFEKVISSGTLNNKGEADIAYNLPDFYQAPSAIAGELKGIVLEKGGRACEGSQSLQIEPYDKYVGLEKISPQYGYFKTGEPIYFRTILLDKQGTVIKNKQLKYKIYKNDRYWWWEYRRDNSLRLKYKSDSSTELVKEGRVQSGRKPAAITYSPELRGNYLLEVTEEDGNGHVASMMFNARAWGSSESGADDANALTINTDKKYYSVGEAAEVTFPAPPNAKILVSIEKGNTIIDSYWTKTKPNVAETKISIPLTEKMVPNIYASISVIQPHKQTDNDRPMRLFGVVPIEVKPVNAGLGIDIIADDELKPKKKFDVNIQTKDNSQAQFTVAVVDEGLLALTNYSTPNPLREFYKKIALKIKTYDIFGKIVGANKGDIFKRFSVGGGSDSAYRKKQLKERKVQRFKPVSLFKGPIETDAKGAAKVSFTMPDYIGAVRVMVVAAKNKRYGNSEKTIPVKTDLMILPTLPRRLSPKDSFVLPVTIFALKDQVKNVEVSIEVAGPLQIQESSKQQLRFSSPGDKDIHFKLKVKNEVGPAKVIITAKSGINVTKKEIEIDIVSVSPYVSERNTKSCDAGKGIKMTIPNKGMSGTNKASITISSLPNFSINHRLKYLIKYPYGCIEQTTSSVFPQLFLKKIVNRSKPELDKIDKNINAGIKRLKRFQTSSGGFSFWPGGKHESGWGTNYAGHFLIEAKELGYAVPKNLFVKWLRYQQSRARSRKNTNMLEKIYRLYLLSLAGYPEIGQMNVLKENSLHVMTNTQKWMLAAAYNLAGSSDEAKEITVASDIDVNEETEYRGTYGSALRDQGIILEMLTNLEEWEKSEELVKIILRKLSSDDWYATQTTGYALLATGKYLTNKATEGAAPIEAEIIYNNNEKLAVNTNNISKTISLYKGFGKELEVKNNSGSKLYINLDWEGIPEADEVKSFSKNLGLAVDWLNEKGEKIDPTDLAQGATFWGHFQVKLQDRRRLDECALVQILPSGWEIENIRLKGERLPDWMKRWKVNKEDYLDIRDDRIMWFFDLSRYNSKLDFVVKVRAVTKGSFMLAPTLVEAMYDNRYKAMKAGKKVKVSSY
jgi:alpha-2-macroglobulin